MKIEVGSLYVKKKVLDKILGTDLSFKLSYRFCKLARKIQDEMKHTEKTRNDMIIKYGVQDEKDGTYDVTKATLQKRKEFSKEWAEFAKMEIDFDVEKIPINAIEEASAIELSAYDIVEISDFIDDGIKSLATQKKKPKKESAA